MLQLFLLTGLLGFASAQSASAQSSSALNDWYSASAGSGSSMAASSSSARTSPMTTRTSLTPSTLSSVISSAATSRIVSTTSSSIARSSSTSSSPASSSAARSSAASSSPVKGIRAVATIASFGGSKVQGIITFQQADPNSPTNITYDLSGNTNTPTNQRGIHIHEVGSTNCTAANGHWNPYNKTHALLSDDVRHAGDLGNIAIDSSGNAKGSVISSLVKLSGDKNAIGLTFVVHGGMDDGGKTGVNTSNSTGNSGARVGCGIINLSP